MKKIIYIIAVVWSCNAQAASVNVDPVMALVDPPTCLKLNLYHEGRGEGEAGMLEILKVTLARVMSPEFPNTICDVVWDRRSGCQFSWTCDKRRDNKIEDFNGWNRANAIVNSWFDGSLSINLDSKMLYYHASTIPKPSWFSKAKLKKIKEIGKHIFYHK